MALSPAGQCMKVVNQLRDDGFKVIDTHMPPREWSQSSFKPNGVLLHHTASSSTTNVANELADVRYIKHVPWGGPGAQFYVGRTGRIYSICRGGAAHAGTGNGLIKYGIPLDQGNYELWGIEVQSRGLSKDWTKAQWKSVHWLTARLLLAMGETDASRVWRHKDYDNDSGKIDTQYPLSAHRAAVRTAMKQLQRRNRLHERIDATKRLLKRLREKLREIL